MQVFFNTSFWHKKLCGFWRAVFLFHITRCFLFCWTKLQGNNMQSTNPQEIFGHLSQILTWGPNPSCELGFVAMFFSFVLFKAVIILDSAEVNQGDSSKYFFCFSYGNRYIWAGTGWFEGKGGSCGNVATHLPCGCSPSLLSSIGHHQGNFDLTSCIHLSVLCKVLCILCLPFSLSVSSCHVCG